MAAKVISTDDSGQTSALPSIRVAEVFPGVVVTSRGDVYGRKATQDRRGYLYVKYGGKQRYLHRVIAKTFLPPAAKRRVVRHLNDVKDDNRVENLAWGSHRDNYLDALRNGGRKSQLTPSLVADLREKAHAGTSMYALAKRHDLSCSVVRNAVRGVTWREVASPPLLLGS